MDQIRKRDFFESREPGQSQVREASNPVWLVEKVGQAGETEGSTERPAEEGKAIPHEPRKTTFMITWFLLSNRVNDEFVREVKIEERLWGAGSGLGNECPEQRKALLASSQTARKAGPSVPAATRHLPPTPP